MDSKRKLGFWNTAGVLYDVDRSVSFSSWIARIPGRPDIAGYGCTKRLALGDLKSASARANSYKAREFRLVTRPS